MGIDSRWVIEHPEWFISLPEPALPRLHLRRREPRRGRARRDPPRGPLLGQQRRGRGVRAARPADRRAALRLPRQRRHQLPVERHRPARLHPGRGPGAGHPDDRRRRAAVPGDPLRRRDGAGQASTSGGCGSRAPARAAARSRRGPSSGRCPRPSSTPRCPTSSGARSSTGSPSRRPTRSCWPRRSGCSRATSSGPSGMHRVYNCAFMHMLRDEDNAGYRRVLKETLEFDPEILKRYVNFMNNPDEKTAVEQFGKGDKYIGVATLLATLPGLPMFGHGQFEGFAEKYGMEFRRATHGRAAGRVAHRAPRARDRPAAPPARRLRRGARLPAVRRRERRRRRRRARVRLLQRLGSRAVADRVPQPLRRDRGLDPRLGRVRGQGDPTGRRRWCAGRWRTGLGLAEGPGRRSMAGDARAALGARVPALGRGDPRARHARRAPGLRDARVLGAPRAVRRGRRLGPAGRAARRRGVPSLEGALRELQLAPVHDALRAAMAAPSGPGGRAAGQRRRRRHGDRAATGPRVVRGHPRRWSPRRSRSRRRSTTPRRRRRFARWALLAAARVAAVGRQRRRDEPGVVRGAPARAGRRRRAARPAASTRPAAWGAAERVRLLLDLPLPSTVGGKADGLPLRLVDAWLADPVVRSFLRINRWDDADWFNRESWLELARLDRSPRARPDAARGAGPAPGRAVRPRAAAGRGRRGVGLPRRRRCARRWRRAPRPASPAAGRTSRLPKATGLPPGPKDATIRPTQPGPQGWAAQRRPGHGPDGPQRPRD